MNQCYECKYRSDIPGDAHSSCQHPSTKNASKDERLATLLSLLGGAGRAGALDQKAADELHIKANFHGIKKGWFNWPYNFDPVWLENCDGFTKKVG